MNSEVAEAASLFVMGVIIRISSSFFCLCFCKIVKRKKLMERKIYEKVDGRKNMYVKKLVGRA